MTTRCPVPEPAVHEDALEYSPYPRSVSLARRWGARLLTEWGMPQLAGDAAVLLTELAINAVLHGALPGRLFRVRLTLVGATLRIAVTDPRGERVPRRRAPDPDDQFGRGLVIVEMLADRWGVEEHEIGKTVWCEISASATRTR